MNHAMRVLVFAMRCAFSAPPLDALVRAGHEVVAVVLPGVPGGPAWVPVAPVPRPRLPVTGSVARSPLDDLVQAHGLPVVGTGSPGDPAALEAIASLAPDVIVVACFPRRLPAGVLALAPLGALNVHPSLLPRWRGPDPLFWTFHAGDAEAGVTIHRLVHAFDAGDVLSQRRVVVPAGTRLPDLERQLARFGGALLVDALAEVAAGTLHPVAQQGDATWAPVPTAGDFRLSTHWTAERAYRFVRGVAPVHGPMIVMIGDGRAEPVSDAVMFGPASPSTPSVREGDGEVEVRFADGVVRFVLPPG